MNSYLKYTGSIPIYALKHMFAPGDSVDLQYLWEVLHKQCKVSSNLDSEFITWLIEAHIKPLGSNFSLIIDKTDLEGYMADPSSIALEKITEENHITAKKGSEKQLTLSPNRLSLDVNKPDNKNYNINVGIASITQYSGDQCNYFSAIYNKLKLQKRTKVLSK